MYNNVYVRKLLTSDDINVIRKLVEFVDWVPGSDSNINPYIQKVNEQVEIGSATYDRIDQIVANRIMSDTEHNLMTLPVEITKTGLSRMKVGGKYSWHCDEAFLGHYSTTTFISDVDKYEGGELVLKIDGEFREYKLPAGHSVTYLTGTPHMVKEVTDGERVVCINWTKSQVNSPSERDILSDLNRCCILLNEHADELLELDLFKNDDPTQNLQQLIFNINQKFKRHIL